MTLQRFMIGFTRAWAIVFLPIETYLTWTWYTSLVDLSGYIVNVTGVGITIYALWCLRRGRPYAEGLLAAGWAWTAAVFWRATNLRYWLAWRGEELSFDSLELLLAPVFTALAAAAFVGALMLMIRRETRPKTT
jgi:hypothetical protein